MKFPGFQLTLSKSSCCSIQPSQVAVELFCCMSIIVILSRNELPVPTGKQTLQCHSVPKILYVAAVTGRNGLAPRMGW